MGHYKWTPITDADHKIKGTVLLSLCKTNCPLRTVIFLTSGNLTNDVELLYNQKDIIIVYPVVCLTSRVFNFAG